MFSSNCANDIKGRYVFFNRLPKSSCFDNVVSGAHCMHCARPALALAPVLVLALALTLALVPVLV